MSRHLVFNPDGSAAGSFPGAINANSVYDLASIMDEPFDIRSGVDPLRFANLAFRTQASSGQQSGLSSQGLLTSNGVSGLGAAEIGVVSGNGYQIAVGQTVGTQQQLEIEYDERGTVENPL